MVDLIKKLTGEDVTGMRAFNPNYIGEEANTVKIGNYTIIVKRCKNVFDITIKEKYSMLTRFIVTEKVYKEKLYNDFTLCAI